MTLFSFYTPWKRQRIRSFLMLSRGIESETFYFGFTCLIFDDIIRLKKKLCFRMGTLPGKRFKSLIRTYQFCPFPYLYIFLDPEVDPVYFKKKLFFNWNCFSRASTLYVVLIGSTSH